MRWRLLPLNRRRVVWIIMSNAHQYMLRLAGHLRRLKGIKHLSTTRPTTLVLLLITNNRLFISLYIIKVLY